AAEAKDKGMDVKASKFPLSGNGRALSLNQTEGFVRLVTTKEDNVLVGAQVVGVNASEIIAELGLAIEAGMNAEDIALTIHGHPSLSETIMDAAELALGMPIHI
ncbi:MAG: dihydrolipoyl dehydrogenase, partial [Trichococcus sp.]|nr:dihydrolipoyl dehydrogenase [Trichococcus sp.]